MVAQMPARGGNVSAVDGPLAVAADPALTALFGGDVEDESGTRHSTVSVRRCTLKCMCRNIRTLFNFDPPANDEEIRAASLQFVRKLSGFTKPSKANQEAFDRAVEDVAAVAKTLLDSLVTNAEPKDRETEAVRARERSAQRFGQRG